MTEEVFNSIKLEIKIGHTVNYSALLHDLTVDEVKAIITAKDYVEFCKENQS